MVSVVVLLVTTAYVFLRLVYVAAVVRYRGRAASRVSGTRSCLPEGCSPSVDVIGCCYNESPERLRACLSALDALAYAGRVCRYVVDDGSVNADELGPAYGEFAARPGWTVLRLERNRGKRRAQDAAFQVGDGDLVFSVDSDTVVAADSLTLLAAALGEGAVAGATGWVVPAGGGFLRWASTVEFEVLC
ncbi:glycosyltransferase family 2 protein [Streptomyces sp. NPDC087866]|uniref:glycosyltransferase family 2 protein n=1 Tax=unclassified Streptomyces TaxID=2593676 RepID=UPI0033A801FB